VAASRKATSRAVATSSFSSAPENVASKSASTAACPVTCTSRPGAPPPSAERSALMLRCTWFSLPGTRTTATAALPLAESVRGLAGPEVRPSFERARASSARARARSTGLSPERLKKTTSAGRVRPERKRASRRAASVEGAPAGSSSLRRLDSTEPSLAANGADDIITATQKPTPSQLARRPVTRAANRSAQAAAFTARTRPTWQ
jgi:hypothetical protein